MVAGEKGDVSPPFFARWWRSYIAADDVPEENFGRPVDPTAAFQNLEGSFQTSMRSMARMLPASVCRTVEAKVSSPMSLRELALCRREIGKTPKIASMPPAATTRARATSMSEKPERRRGGVRAMSGVLTGRSRS